MWWTVESAGKGSECRPRGGAEGETERASVRTRQCKWCNASTLAMYPPPYCSETCTWSPLSPLFSASEGRRMMGRSGSYQSHLPSIQRLFFSAHSLLLYFLPRLSRQKSSLFHRLVSHPPKIRKENKWKRYSQSTPNASQAASTSGPAPNLYTFPRRKEPLKRVVW